jgi:hypothetical protein
MEEGEEEGGYRYVWWLGRKQNQNKMPNRDPSRNSTPRPRENNLWVHFVQNRIVKSVDCLTAEYQKEALLELCEGFCCGSKPTTFHI